MNATITTAEREMAATALKGLARTHRAFTRWLAVCEALSADRTNPARIADWERTRMPSKNAKHAMYGDAGRVIRLLGLDTPRPATMADLADVIAAARAALA